MASKDYLLSGFADEIDGDLDKQIRVLKDLGMSYVEFRSAYGKNVSDYSLDEAMEIKNKLDANGIKVSSIGSTTPVSNNISCSPLFNLSSQFWYFNLFSSFIYRARIVLLQRSEVLNGHIPLSRSRQFIS